METYFFPQDPTHPVIAHGHEDYDHSSWFSAYLPEEEDGCYLDHTQLAADGGGGGTAVASYSEDVRCWWHMRDGRVLGVHDGMVVEYDQELLAPIGVVRDREQLKGREVVVIEGGDAVMLVPREGGGGDASDVEVIHPNAKGGYSTVFQRNKAVRTKEMEREEMAQQASVYVGTYISVFRTWRHPATTAVRGFRRRDKAKTPDFGAVRITAKFTVHRSTGMRRPKSSHRRAGGGGGGGGDGGNSISFRTVARVCILFCGLPLAVLAYASMGWRAWNRRGGSIASASRGGCFGPQEERARHGGGGTGALRHIASAYLQSDQLLGGVCGGRKAVAFAISLTKEGHHLDGAAVLAASIDAACETSDFLCDLVAFLHDEIGLGTETLLRRLGFRVMRPGLPLNLDEIEDPVTRRRIAKGGCCGPAELMKLFAYTLTEYHRVVHLDTDTIVLQPLDALLDAEESLLYTPDVNMGNAYTPVMPVQGGFLVVRPDPEVFQDLIQIVKSTPFKPSEGWGGSMIGLFWGGINIQGILPYYYEHRAPAGVSYRSVDRSVYNNMVDRPSCQAVDISTVRQEAQHAHFTNCLKPWECLYPHPKQPLCSRLVERWFEMRTLAESALDQTHTEACPTGYRSDYTPITLLAPKPSEEPQGP
ncbi:unnamed protein product [Ectocarpus fasciculatus]